jgi:hypothetical protein
MKCGKLPEDLQAFSCVIAFIGAMKCSPVIFIDAAQYFVRVKAGVNMVAFMGNYGYAYR